MYKKMLIIDNILHSSSAFVGQSRGLAIDST